MWQILKDGPHPGLIDVESYVTVVTTFRHPNAGESAIRVGRQAFGVPPENYYPVTGSDTNHPYAQAAWSGAD